MKTFLIIFIVLSVVATSLQEPILSRQNCNHVLELLYGEVSCDPQRAKFALCKFSCDNGYRLRGDETVTCAYYGSGKYLWSDRPSCRSTSCPLIETAENADVDCNGNNPGSFCLHNCFNGFQLYPSDRLYQDCLPDGHWTPAPCCVKKAHCSSTKMADVIVALDSSLSFGMCRWKKVKKFVREFIDLFSTEPNITRFSIFRYDKKVDRANSILLIDSVDDRYTLLETYDAIPDQLRPGHYVSRALRYISNHVLVEENGDRPDVPDIILLITKDHSDERGRLRLPDFNTKRSPKIIVVTVDGLEDLPGQQVETQPVKQVPIQQVQQDQGEPRSYNDPRMYWSELTENIESVHMAESEELAGLSEVLQSDLKPFVCQVEACKKDQTYYESEFPECAEPVY